MLTAATAAIREQRVLACLTAAYVAAVWSLRLFGEKPRQLEWTSLLSSTGSATLLILVVIASMGVARTVGIVLRCGQNAPAPPSDWRALLNRGRIASVFVTLFLYSTLMQAFIDIKSRIPAFQPFRWDATLMRLDRALHFGHDPWVLLQWIPSIGTVMLDRLYYLWFPANLIFVLAMAWQKPHPLRHRFFTAFFGLWIVLGSGVALALSSAGPCYYALVTAGPDPYAELMEHLSSVSSQHALTAVDVQFLLWEGYLGRADQLTEGISAMPSLHVAVPILFAIVGWKIHRAIGIAFAGFAVTIFIGSIHLGWHYAVDGYVSALLTPVIWWITGWMRNRGGG